MMIPMIMIVNSTAPTTMPVISPAEVSEKSNTFHFNHFYTVQNLQFPTL